MTAYTIRRNERDWAGQLVSWLREAICGGQTVFEDVTNDSSLSVKNGNTKFPDILLFTDKVSGIVFNGWELKFPDTSVDNVDMLVNALEKARRLQSLSFVTWNGSEAMIWRIDKDNYSLDTLSRIKHYPPLPTVSTRDDLADPAKYARNEPLLKKRALEILHDLDQLCRDGYLRPAINVSENIIEAIRTAYRIIVPQLTVVLKDRCGIDADFRSAFNQWKIYENSTLKILGSSSHRAESVDPYEVLAQFTFYNLIGKTLFYLTLAENLCGELPPLEIKSDNPCRELASYFDKAGSIDYQAVFKPYFTDDIEFSTVANDALQELVTSLTDFDFKLLPGDVVGNILSNSVPDEDKQKFGQYFTSELLADLVAFPAVSTRQSTLFDPTSGTGSFLNSFYKILSYFGNRSHIDKLSRIWGNDISHFPAILSVINLYKEDVRQVNNFPRVTRDDFFNLNVGDTLVFPDPHDHTKAIDAQIPEFDGIASNFPFIQQEDIPNEKLSALFRQHFRERQAAFLKDRKFKINERSDYFTYCLYNSARFIKEGGIISVITSNAWLGKDYGQQFKKFLLDNFHVKYIVRSKAEHWFKDSQVSTIYLVLKKKPSDDPTRFVTLNFKLSEYFKEKDTDGRLALIEDLYSEIDNCDNPANGSWRKDPVFDGLYVSKEKTVSVAVVSKKRLTGSLAESLNWSQFFISPDMFGPLESMLVRYEGKVADIIRGERTGWNPMFVIPCSDTEKSRINREWLFPYIKSPSELHSIEFPERYKFNAFICDKPLDLLDPGTRDWIERFRTQKNKNGSKTIAVACGSHKPFWYSLSPKSADIVTSVNPYERLFFSYSNTPFMFDQRLIGMQVKEGYDVELIAALLNSAISMLILETRGTPRNLGALDLNANYLPKLRWPNPDLLDEKARKDIIQAFQPLKKRKIKSILEEIRQPDRISFDKAVMNAFNLDGSLLHTIYGLLSNFVSERVSMKNR